MVGKSQTQKFHPLAIGGCFEPSVRVVKKRTEGTKYDEESFDFVRYIYLKQHSVKRKDDYGNLEKEELDPASNIKSDKEILFVANVCPFWTTDDVHRLFSLCPKVEVESVSLGQTGNSKFATIRYTKSSGVRRTLKWASEHANIDNVINEREFFIAEPDKNDYITSGKDLRVISCLKPSKFNILVAQQEIDDYMNDFQSEEKMELERQKVRESQVDEDGFEIVSYKKSAKRKTLSMDATEMETIAKTKARNKKKQKSREFQNFYRFQMREAKRERLATLREKFEQDKLQIQRLKEARKFKPY
uniref:Ribosomal RNA-processing protein 7 C-terminal domain-containing protein n=1 Tax=Aplanochytrium stocchinoi TaxID=215587 RepID=A0A7S3LQP9_9STRA|mmetsp:Transcript_8610/g.10159  ORF Transcript_8610/g.10159 Transcript_8610/m.10159 type:complete len:302 (-) Transcript_8610:400-1305(-)